MKRYITVVGLCLVLSFLAQPLATSADAMQDILTKKADVERALNEIVRAAGDNLAKPADKRTPDAALERAIALLEAELKSMDFRLESLPACQKAPAPPDPRAAIEAIKRCLTVPKGLPDAQKREKELEQEIRTTKERIDYVTKVKTISEYLIQMKLFSAGLSIAFEMVPSGVSHNVGGKVYDLIKVLVQAADSTYDLSQPGQVRNWKGRDEYLRYLQENKDEINKSMSQRAQQKGMVDPKTGKLKMTPYEAKLMGNDFVVEVATRELEVKWRRWKEAIKEHADAKKEREKLEKENQANDSRNRYFNGLVSRVEDIFRDSKWVQNPAQFEKMTAEIKVTVVDDKSGNLITTANVKVSPTAGSARTAGNPFEFEKVANGAYAVDADATGYVKDSSAVTVADCKVYAVNVRLKKKPVIRIADIKDENGNLLDNIKVDLANLGGGAGASGNYSKAPIDFNVDPGAFTVTGTDPADKFEVASANVNADAGNTTDVHLVMSTKGVANFVVEVYDALTGQKIDPPPGSQEPYVTLEPLDGQPKPTGLPYAGKGERLFSRVQAGRYKMVASFCGWESATDTITVAASELASPRTVRKITVKPTKLDSFVGNLLEEGTSNHINGFKVTLIGLGPRQGYRYETVEGKHPDPTIHIFFGAFYIPGPIYSGHYRLIIERDCYQPIVRDQWWTFCGINPGWQSTYSPQIYQMKPTPEFEQARQQARGLIRQIKAQREKANKAADAVAKARRGMQDAPDLARELVKELTALKARYPALEQECLSASASITEITNNLQLITNAANQIIVLRETAKNLAGVACQLSDEAQRATDPAKAANHGHNSRQFAEQAKKKADEATQLALAARKAYNAVAPKLTALTQLEQRIAGLKRDFAPLATKLKNLRTLLSDAANVAKSIAETDAAVAEATRLLNTVRGLLQPCATANSAKNLLEEAQREQKAVTGEQTRARDENTLLQGFLTSAQTLTTQAETLGTEVERMLTACDGVKGLAGASDAKANTDTIEAFALVAQQSAKAAQDCADKAKPAGVASQQLINQIQQAIARCEYEDALKTAQQLQQSDPTNQWLTLNLADLQRNAAAQQQARVSLRQGMEAIQRKDLDGAISGIRQALGTPNLPACMSDKATELLKELERKKQFIDLTRQVESATTRCDYREAQNRVGDITRLTPRDPEITDWINTNVPKMAELLQKEQQAKNFIATAEAKANQASTLAATEPVDWQTVNRVIQEAAQSLVEADKVAPKCMDRQKMEGIRRQLEGIKKGAKPQIEASIVLLIDTSGSMAESAKIEKAKAAARAAAQKATKTTEIAVLNFDGGCDAGGVKYACRFTTDVNALLAAIDALRPGGGTPMYIATGVAVEYAKREGKGKQRTVVLMTDGADSCTGDQKAQAAASIRTSNIPVNAIGFDVGTNQQAQTDLGNLAAITGGRTFSASAADPKEIIRAFEVAMLPTRMKNADFDGSGGQVQAYFDAAKNMIHRQDLMGATNQLMQAYRVAPESAAVNYNLALLYEADEKPMTATRYAENYLKLAPNALDRGDIESRIQTMKKDIQENPRVIYDTNSCRDIVNWALAEEPNARKEAARRLAVLEIRGAAQRGDCEKARQLQAAYKQRY